MRVLLFIDSLTTGGAQRQLVGLAALLTAKGYQVSVATYFDEPFYAEDLHLNHIAYVCIPNSQNRFRRIFQVYRHFRKLRPDLVIAYLETPGILAVLVRLFGCRYKLIVSERNTTQKPGIKDKIRFFLFRFADRIVPNSYSQSQFIITHYPNLSSKTTTITNFVDTEYFKPGEYHLTGEPLRILTIGRIAPQKNVLKYIQAIGSVLESGTEVRVDWYGNGLMNDGMSDQLSPYYLECIALIKSYNLENHFFFHPPVREVRMKYHECDVFCLPSVYEGFPNVICEAMACGKPILAGNICDNRLLVEEGINGYLFDPQTPDSIVQSINKFSNQNPEERMQFGKSSRYKAIKEFSGWAFLQKYIDLAEQI